MNNDLLYRRGSADDFSQLMQLGIASYNEFSKILTPDNWAILNKNLNNKERLTGIITSAKIFVCEADEHIVGVAYLLLSGNPDHIYPADWCYIRMVGVHPRYRDKGIGKKLTAMCIDHAREKGERIIALHTSEIMNAARHVYEGLGFQVYKEIAPIFGVKYWVYKRDL